MSGLLSIYFLFDNYFYFVLFAILHLFLDALDGVLARISGETFFGKCFDMATDNFITFLALIKVGFFINDIYPQIIAFLYLVIVGVHLQSKFKIPVIFIRSAALGVLIVSSYPTFPYMGVMLTVGYLAAGATTVFSLARQLQWFFGRKI